MDEDCRRESNVEDFVKKIKHDPSKMRDEKLCGPKEGFLSDATSCISSGDATSSIRESDLDQDSAITDQSQSILYPANQFYGYFYPESSDEQTYSVGRDSFQAQNLAAQSGNVFPLYYLPGVQQSGYGPYCSLFPGAVFGADGYYVGLPYYAASFPPTIVSSGYFSPSVAYGPELVPAYWDPSLFSDGFPSYTYGFNPEISIPKSNFPTNDNTISSGKTSSISKSVNSEKRGSYPSADAFQIPGFQNEYPKQKNKAASGSATKGILTRNKFPSYSNNGKSNLLHVKDAGRGWFGSERHKNKNKGYTDLEFASLNDDNSIPENANSGSKGSSVLILEHAGSQAVEEHRLDEPKKNHAVSKLRREDYNLIDFPPEYDYAMFFVIKSYSEDDIHKSIKYNVWTSTSNGNKRLDNAYQVAQEKMVQKGSKCPLFLFYSVNASGQFCGVAEMTGHVDFSKNMDFWQQDRWNGFFPVKWHIIKDIPNLQFRHIILENNENKPVTNSRDTQELKFSQGIEMLNIFKNYTYKTSILDDFEFYENRQKAMQEKKARNLTSSFDHLEPKTKSNEVSEPYEPGGDTVCLGSATPPSAAAVMPMENMKDMELKLATELLPEI